MPHAVAGLLQKAANSPTQNAVQDTLYLALKGPEQEQPGYACRGHLPLHICMDVNSSSGCFPKNQGQRDYVLLGIVHMIDFSQQFLKTLSAKVRKKKKGRG